MLKYMLGAITGSLRLLGPAVLVFLFCHSLNGQRSHQDRTGQGRDGIDVLGNKTAGFPNILLILVDDLGYGDLSIMGARDMHTPHIDALAEDGLLFTSFYANSPVCSPSRAALLTGRYPDMVGVPGVIRQNVDNSYGSLKAAVPMATTTLRDAGYETALIGKWHLGLESPNTPNARGFDFFKGFLGDMMDDYYTHLRRGKHWMRFNDAPIYPKGHATDIFTDWAVDYLADDHNGKPFFLYLAYNAPHFPIQPPKAYLEKVLEREKGISLERAKNVAFIEHLDASVGRVLTQLDQQGLADDTLVIFTSDNGGSLRHAQSNGALRGGKQDMYEGGIRVPAFMRWNKTLGAGRRIDTPVMLMDMYPTLCDIIGIPTPPELNGRSQKGVILGEDQGAPLPFTVWVRREGGFYGGLSYYAARKGSLKLVQNTPFEPFQFFDILKDPKEQYPISETDHEGIKELRYLLQQHIITSGAVPWRK